MVSHSVTQEVACANFLLTSQAGDHLQLPPTLKSSDRLTKSLGSKSSKATSKEGTAPPAQPGKLTLSPDLEVTLFSRLLALHGPSIRRMLKVQYRFNAKINSFPSTMLYDGELVPDESVKDRKLSDLEGVEADEDLDEPVVFFDSTFGLTTPGLTCIDLLASRAAAGQAMYERAAEDGSFGSASKSNENEAECVPRQALLVYTLLIQFLAVALCTNTSRRSSTPMSRLPRSPSSRPTTAKSSSSPRSSTLSTPRLRSVQSTAIRVAKTASSLLAPCARLARTNSSCASDVVIVSLVRSNAEVGLPPSSVCVSANLASHAGRGWLPPRTATTERQHDSPTTASRRGRRLGDRVEGLQLPQEVDGVARGGGAGQGTLRPTRRCSISRRLVERKWVACTE